MEHACPHTAPPKRVVAQLGRIQDTRCHRLRQRAGVAQGSAYTAWRQRSDRLQRHPGFIHQLGAPLLDCRVAAHLRRPLQGIFDRPARQPAGLDHIRSRRGVVRFGVADHMHDVRLQCHLQIDAGCQVCPGSGGIQRVAQQPGAGLPPDAEISL